MSNLFRLLPALALLAAAGCRSTEPAHSPPDPDAPPRVMTVDGWLPAVQMGETLMHEHVLVDFAGVDVVSPTRYDADSVFARVRPFLEQVYDQGIRTFIEATPAYLGRDPALLRRLSEATGLHILTNTGYYSARDKQHLPPHFYDEDADALAARWISEWENSIDGTGVRPGFIKIGFDRGPLDDDGRKLIRAAARTHRATGLTIAAHTGTAPGAFDQLAALAEEGVDPSAWIWIHAQNEDDLDRHVEAARQGAWISFDGLGPDNVEAYVDRLLAMKAAGVLGRVLVSHDAGWYRVGEPGGGAFRAYDTLFHDFLPALRREGFTDAEIHRLTVDNPAEAFAFGFA